MTRKRPIVVSFNDYVDCSTLLLSYITDGFVRCKETMPSDWQLMNVFYRNHPKGMQMIYAQRHKRPEGPMDSFKSEMSSIEDSDHRSESYNNVLSQYQLSVVRAKDRSEGRAPRPPKNKPGQAQCRSDICKPNSHRDDYTCLRYSERISD